MVRMRDVNRLSKVNDEDSESRRVQEEIVFTEITMNEMAIVIETIKKRQSLGIEVSPVLRREGRVIEFFQLRRRDGFGGSVRRDRCGGRGSDVGRRRVLVD
jgi:hypothetical protein